MNGSVLSLATKGSGKMTKSLIYMITAVTAIFTVVVAIVKAIWFRVDYMHESITVRNGEVKYDKRGKPIVKTAGWRCQFPVRDHQRPINCEQMTSHLTTQHIMAGDGKNEIGLTVRWHVLNRRDGERYIHYPVRTLAVNDLNQYLEEVCRDAVRFVMANSKDAASKWASKDLYKAMQPQVKKKLEKVGLSFDEVMLPNASQSEAQVQGNLIRDAGQLIKDGMLRIESPAFLPDQPAAPDLTVVPS